VKRPNRRPQKPIDNKAGARVIELEREGWKRTAAVRQVAEEHKCSERTVQKALARHNALLQELFELSGVDPRKKVGT
jgi:hypothetical protein